MDVNTFLKQSGHAPGIDVQGDNEVPHNKTESQDSHPNMKRLMPISLGTATLCLALGTAAWAEDLLPGQADFGTFAPPKEGGEFVEVNVPGSLISLGAAFFDKQDQDIAKLLRGLKLVRVNVIGMNDENRGDIQKRAQRVRKDLTSKGWERIVTAQEKDQDVGIYLKMNQGAIQGFAAVVLDGDKEAVFVNIVGEIKPEQVALIGEKLHLDPLQKLGEAVSKPQSKPAEPATPESPEDPK
jgi:hypothetical protein